MSHPLYRFDPSLISPIKLPKEFENSLFLLDWGRGIIRCSHLCRFFRIWVKSHQPHIPGFALTLNIRLRKSFPEVAERICRLIKSFRRRCAGGSPGL